MNHLRAEFRRDDLETAFWPPTCGRVVLACRSEVFGLRRPMHDRMLVLNIGIFNVENGWSRIFNPVKAHENGI
jgi:hypothetical protein